MKVDKISAILVLKRLLRYAISDRRILIVALISLGLATIGDVAGPYLIKIFLDDYVSQNVWPMAAITTLAVFYIAAQIVSAMASYRQAVLFNVIAMNSVQKMREKIFTTILHRPMVFFDTVNTGSLVSRITNDTESIKELYTHVIGTIVQSSVRIFGILVAMAILDYKLMLICLGFIFAVAALMAVYQRISTPIFSRMRSLLSDINARLHESIQGMQIIQLMNQQSRYAENFATVSQDHFFSRKRSIRVDSILLRPMIDVFYLSTLSGILFVYGHEGLRGPVEIGVVYAFVSYLTRFIEPVAEMTQRLGLLNQAVVAADRVFQLTDETVVSSPQISSGKIQQGRITLKDVSFAYKSEQTVLHNLNLDIAAGQFIALVGHTGSGKSTIASLLMRFYPTTKGNILIDNFPLEDILEEQIYQHIAIVQQDSFIISGTIIDNICLGANISREEAIKAAQAAHMQYWVDCLPQKYDTLLKEKGANLSTGQRQQISLARALARQPKILIMDEATANVDSQTEHEIQRVILGLKGKVTIVMIAHRLSTVKDADRIIVLHGGEIVQSGTHKELLKIDGLYRHLYQLQEYHFHS